jgi:hypothetical protein
VTTNRRPRSQRIRPLPKGDTLYTPGASAARQAAERRSARPLMYLHQLPAWIAPLVLVGLLIAGLAVKGPGGGVALLGVAASRTGAKPGAAGCAGPATARPASPAGLTSALPHSRLSTQVDTTIRVNLY